jgi:hypothetical protein
MEQNRTPRGPARWHTSVIPVVGEAEVGGSQSEAGPGQKHETPI